MASWRICAVGPGDDVATRRILGGNRAGCRDPSARSIAARCSSNGSRRRTRCPSPPWILVHGGGGQGTDYTITPDGRPGWSRLLVERGHTVYVVDRPGHGRSPHHPDVLGAMGPQLGYEFLRPIFVPPPDGPDSNPTAHLHTQWPGGREPATRFTTSACAPRARCSPTGPRCTRSRRHACRSCSTRWDRPSSSHTQRAARDVCRRRTPTRQGSRADRDRDPRPALGQAARDGPGPGWGCDLPDRFRPAGVRSIRAGARDRGSGRVRPDPGHAATRAGATACSPFVSRSRS